MKRKRQKFYKAILLFCFVNALLLMFWMWILYITQTATSANTYQTDEIIIDVEVPPIIHRENATIFLYTNDNRYMIEAPMRSFDECSELADKIASSNEELKLTVWEHTPKAILQSSYKTLMVKQVVFLQSADEVYFDISEHNEYQKSERICGVIACIFFTLIIVPLNIPMCMEIKKNFRGKSALRKSAKRKAARRKRIEEKWNSIIKCFNNDKTDS